METQTILQYGKTEIKLEDFQSQGVKHEHIVKCQDVPITLNVVETRQIKGENIDPDVAAVPKLETSTSCGEIPDTFPEGNKEESMLTEYRKSSDIGCDSQYNICHGIDDDDDTGEEFDDIGCEYVGDAVDNHSDVSVTCGDSSSDDNQEGLEDGSCEDDSNTDDEDDYLDIPRSLHFDHNTLHEVTTVRWPPGSWQDGTRKSAFQPYKPTLLLTNLQRGNIPTESSVVELTDVSFHHRAGQGEINLQDIDQERNIDVKDKNGLSALMWASAYGQVPTVQLLVQHGAEVDLEGNEGETSLLLAAAGGHHDVVRLLLSEGAHVNHADEIGNTALMYAAHGDHSHCTNELLLRGADITLTNLKGDTAFGIAVKRGSKLVQAVVENFLLTLFN